MRRKTGEFGQRDLLSFQVHVADDIAFQRLSGCQGRAQDPGTRSLRAQRAQHGEGGGNLGLPGTGRDEGILVSGVGARLRRGDEACPHAHAGGSGREGGGDAAGRSDSAAGKDRDGDCIEDAAEQGEKGKFATDVTARLSALGDDQVTSRVGRGPCLANRPDLPAGQGAPACASSTRAASGSLQTMSITRTRGRRSLDAFAIHVVGEEVCADRTRGCRADAVERLDELVDGPSHRGECAEAAGVGHSTDKFGACHGTHGGLLDRDRAPDQVSHGSVEHRLLLSPHGHGDDGISQGHHGVCSSAGWGPNQGYLVDVLLCWCVRVYWPAARL